MIRVYVGVECSAELCARRLMERAGDGFLEGSERHLRRRADERGWTVGRYESYCPDHAEEMRR